MTAIFHGLTAFPLTPLDRDGAVDTAALAIVLDRLVAARVDAIGLLGSTGLYAYLDRRQRGRAVAAAVEAVAGRVPLIVGVGALRTDWACDLARDAARAGADGLLLAPMSYLPLTADEVAAHVRAVALATRLPVCIYDNPTTTRFAFDVALIGDLARSAGIAAIKLPLPADGDYAGGLARLRRVVPAEFAIGYSGDWGAASGLSAGADGWFSVVAGLLPQPASRLTQAGRHAEVAVLEAAFAPLWTLFRAHGSLRLMYAVADRLGLAVGDPPLPLRRVDAALLPALDAALDHLARGAAMADRPRP